VRDDPHDAGRVERQGGGRVIGRHRSFIGS
jgi:hypothetical protein